MAAHAIGVYFEHQMRIARYVGINRRTGKQQFLVLVLVDVAKQAVIAHEIEMIGSIAVIVTSPSRLVAP